MSRPATRRNLAVAQIESQLTSDGIVAKLTSVQRRLIEAEAEIMAEATGRPEFLHSVLCQLGLPRRSQGDKRTFERRSGAASLLIRAGELWRDEKWEPQPLPHGTRPRLVLVHLCSEAVRTGDRRVDVGGSLRQWLKALGLDPSGREYRHFQSQLQALAACEMRLGLGEETVRAQPVESFAWTQQGAAKWPGVIELTSAFFESLGSVAVPLDPRALAALSHSSLALDLYTWLAHRLHRVNRASSVFVPWRGIKEQLGQEYGDTRDLKRDVKTALRAVLCAYPGARLEQEPGGLRLLHSRPPVAARLVKGGCE